MGDHLANTSGQDQAIFKPPSSSLHHQWALSAGAALGNFFTGCNVLSTTASYRSIMQETLASGLKPTDSGLIKHVLQLVSHFSLSLFFFEDKGASYYLCFGSFPAMS